MLAAGSSLGNCGTLWLNIYLNIVGKHLRCFEMFFFWLVVLKRPQRSFIVPYFTPQENRTCIKIYIDGMDIIYQKNSRESHKTLYIWRLLENDGNAIFVCRLLFGRLDAPNAQPYYRQSVMSAALALAPNGVEEAFLGGRQDALLKHVEESRWRGFTCRTPPWNMRFLGPQQIPELVVSKSSCFQWESLNDHFFCLRFIGLNPPASFLVGFVTFLLDRNKLWGSGVKSWTAVGTLVGCFSCWLCSFSMVFLCWNGFILKKSVDMFQSFKVGFPVVVSCFKRTFGAFFEFIWVSFWVHLLFH